MQAPFSEYSIPSRQIAWRIDLYFDGPGQSPLSVTRDNYLVSSEVLEEVSSSSNTPWGNVSANEVSAVLRNENDMFNPGNPQSPYYGKIKKGVRIEVFCRPIGRSTTYDWDPCGVFYIANWVTAAGGLTAEITGYDRIADVFGAGQVKMPVFRDIPSPTFVSAFFDYLQIVPSIDPVQWPLLPFGYHTGDNREFLNNISAGLCAFIYCDHEGRVRVRYMCQTLPVSCTLTDSDQIVDLSAQRSLLLDYDGVHVIWKKPQLSESREVLSVKNLTIPLTGASFEAQLFSQIPVAQLELCSAGLTGLGKMLPKRATALDIDYEVVNDLGRAYADDFSFVGRVVETADTEYMSSAGDNLLKLDNPYCQTEEQFLFLRRFLSAFIASPLPQIEITVRGNPQMEIGQKVRVESTRFNTVFEGLLIRQQLTYNGGLSGRLTLLNSSLLEVT